MQLSEIASHASARVIRDGSFTSLGFVTHRRAGMLVYVNGASYLPALADNPLATCVLTSAELADRVPGALGVAVADDARAAFYRVHEFLDRHTTFYGTARDTVVAPTARIHASATVSATDVEIGDEVEIGPHAVVLPGVRIGAGSMIRAGVVLGSEGFQVVMTNGASQRVSHAGRVVIGRRVDIHSNTCVDRSVFAETVIGDDTTIDNLVHVAHDVLIGRQCRIAAHAMLGGSSSIGEGAWIGPSASISSGIRVGAGAFVTLGSVVTRDVPPDTRVTGNFAIEHEKYLAFLRTIR